MYYYTNKYVLIKNKDTFRVFSPDSPYPAPKSYSVRSSSYQVSSFSPSDNPSPGVTSPEPQPAISPLLAANVNI